jgi:hypothetical protein
VSEVSKQAYSKKGTFECMRAEWCCLCRMQQGVRNNASVSRYKKEAVPRSRSICGLHWVLPMSLALHAILPLRYSPHAKPSTLPTELLQLFRHKKRLPQQRPLPRRQMKPEGMMSYEMPERMSRESLKLQQPLETTVQAEAITTQSLAGWNRFE